MSEARPANELTLLIFKITFYLLCAAVMQHLTVSAAVNLDITASFLSLESKTVWFYFR